MKWNNHANKCFACFVKGLRDPATLIKCVQNVWHGFIWVYVMEWVMGVWVAKLGHEWLRFGVCCEGGWVREGW